MGFFNSCIFTFCKWPSCPRAFGWLAALAVKCGRIASLEATREWCVNLFGFLYELKDRSALENLLSVNYRKNQLLTTKEIIAI